MKEKKMTKTKKILLSIGAVLLAALLFAGGYVTFYFTMDRSIASLWWIKKHIDGYYIWDMTDEEFLSYATEGINGHLDPYSVYYSPEELSDEMSEREGNNTGFGFTFYTTSEGLFIYRVAGGSPAEKAGIRAGDFLFSFGESEQSQTPVKTFAEFSEFLSQKAEGEPVVLATASDSEGSDLVYHTLSRQEYTTGYVTYRSSTSGYRAEGGEWTAFDGALSSLPENVGYIRLTEFYGSAATQMLYALTQMKEEGKTELILDLRGNRGGSLDVLCDLAGYFLKNNDRKNPPVLVARYKGGYEYTYRATDAKGYYDYFFGEEGKITVLADEYTASASECLIGAMLDYGSISYSDILLSEFDGVAKTYGKGIMQTTFTNPVTGEGLKITSAKIYWPLSDTCIHGVGVTPADGARSMASELFLTFSDRELERILSEMYPVT